MDERHYTEPWDDGVYGTGRTQPPKSNNGPFALLLILVIFLCGIITLLSILNVRLFQQLNKQEEESQLAISFTPEPTEAATEPEPIIESTVPSVCAEAEMEIAIYASPESVENIPQEGGMSLQDIYQQNIPSVVSISSSMGTGTGVILSADGYIVTNAHVGEDAASISIRLTDDRDFTAQLIGCDTVSDLAVLRIDARDLLPAQFGDSDILRVGDSVAAIGDPLGVDLRGTYTDGIISAINRDVNMNGRTMTLIQTNAALISGNSGGPLINCYGQVIGIKTMKIGALSDSAGEAGIGFAIPSATVKDIVSQLIAQGYVSGRPTLGVLGESLPLFYQHYYRLPAGLYITEVKPGSAAEKCGMEKGDILISVNESRITDFESLQTAILGYEVGDTVTVTVYREGQTATAQVVLTEDKG